MDNAGDRHPTLRLRLAVPALMALLLRCAGAFAASIVYIQDGNVWLASADGTIQRQVTVNGTANASYYSPSQADDGTIVVGGGNVLFRMDQSGRLLGPPIPTLVSEKPANVYAVGPFNPRVSPDGSMVAYWIGLAAGSYDPGCDCYLTSPVESVVYARADGTGTLGVSRFWQTPSWIDNDHVLLFAPGNRQTPQVGIATLSALGDEHGWFNDDGEGFEGFWQNLDDGELDRGGRKLVLVRGMQAERLSIYAVTDFTNRPVLACEGDNPSGTFSSPSWSPDGLALAWSENDGVWVSSAPEVLTKPEDCTTFAPVLLLPGASQPRWGIADVLPLDTHTPTPSATVTNTPTAIPTTTASLTPTLPATATASATSTTTAVVTAMPTATTAATAAAATPTASAPPTWTATAGATATSPRCTGDCDGDAIVTVDELVHGVNIALGIQAPESCVAFDVDADGSVTVDELLRAVNVLLSGC